MLDEKVEPEHKHSTLHTRVTEREAIQMTSDMYSYLSVGSREDCPLKVWNLGVDFLCAMMEEKPEGPMHWAERWFLQRGIEEAKKNGAPVKSLEDLLSGNAADRFRLERLLNTMINAKNDVDQTGSTKPHEIDEVLYHVRTFEPPFVNSAMSLPNLDQALKKEYGGMVREY